MPNEYINDQRKVFNIELTEELYNRHQDEAWDVVNSFNKTTSVKNKQGSKKAKYDLMNLSELRDQLLNEKGSKSETFSLMTDEVDKLIKLAASKGVYEDKELGQTRASFFDTFYRSKEAVNRYLFSHSGYHMFDKGERRYQIALRIKSIFNEMERLVEEKASALNEKEARMIEYKSNGYTQQEMEDAEKAYGVNALAADVNKLIETGLLDSNLPKEQLDKSLENWALNDYTAYISKLVEGKKLTTEDDKNNLIAFLEDKNNRLLANKIAFPLILDKRKDITLGMPWVREELSDHIEMETNEEDFFLKPQEFIKKVDAICDNYKTVSSEIIEKYDKRRELIFGALKIPKESANTYRYSAMEMMITAESDEQFKDLLDTFKDHTNDTDDYIEQQLKKSCSNATRDRVREKLYEHLGSFRVFGTRDQVLAQTDIFLEMLQYVSPDEYRVERRLRKLLDDFGLEESYRDVLLDALTHSAPNMFLNADDTDWKSEGKKIAERIHKNRESAHKLMEKKGQLLTKSQWSEIEEKAISNSAFASGDFKLELYAIISRKDNGKKYSLREYRENKCWDDESKFPYMLKKISIEQKRLDDLGDKLDKKFLVHLSGDGKKTYLPYRPYSMAYKNKNDDLIEQEKLENSRFENRKDQLREVLLSGGVNENELESYYQKFKWFMSGLIDITEDMSPDTRLVAKRRNIERFGVISFEEALLQIKALGAGIKDIDNQKEVKEARDIYEKGVKALENYDSEKYKEFVPFIINIPEVYAELLKGEESFRSFIEDTLDGKLSDFLMGCNKAGKHDSAYKGKTKYVISGAARQIYAHMFIRGIYEGTLKGDSDFYAKQLDDFQSKLFKLSAKGGISLNGAIKLASKQIDKKLEKEKLNSNEARLLKLSVMQELYAKVEKIEDFQEITNKKSCKDFVSRKFDELKNRLQSTPNEAEILNNIKTFMDSEVDDNDQEVLEDISTKKENGRLERLKFLKINDYVLNEIRQGKTLVRVTGKGQKAITIDESRINKMRGRVDKYCDELDLPQVLKDALIERGAAGGIIPGITDTYGNSEVLFNHALVMKRLYDLLKTYQVNDKGMGDEEVLMFIVKCYGNSDLINKWFDKPENLNTQEIRKSQELKIFRNNYKKLQKLEKIESDDPSLQQEIDEIRKNLRTMLITGMGGRDENNKTVKGTHADLEENSKHIGEIIDKSAAYIDYWKKVMEVIRPGFIDIYKESADPAMQNKNFSLPQSYVDRLMFSLRQYFMEDVVGELSSDHEFSTEFWKNKLELFRKKEYRNNLYSQSNAVTSSDFIQKEQTALTNDTADEKAIASLIRANLYIFKGKANKYDALDDEQKKLFAIGLMFLDSSAIGLGTEGTMALTEATEKKNKKLTAIQAELEKYVSGQEYHFDINYRDALNKLLDFGISGVGLSDFKISEAAYDRAMKFAMKISKQKSIYGEKDVERISDSYASVFSAYTKFGKKQLTHIDALRGRTLTVTDLKKRLIDYAVKDKLSKTAILQKALKASKDKFYLGPLVGFAQAGAIDESIALNRRMNRIIKRFKEMSDGDLKIFVRILQDRTAIDKSCIKTDGAPLYVDQNKRDALLETLSGDPDISADVLAGFDDSESCFKAFTTVLSFQLRDDKNFSGKDLTKDCFKKNSLNRDTTVDWELIENAFKFIDEIMEKKTSIQALKNHGELIKYAGNKKAFERNEELKQKYSNKADFKLQNFEDLVKEHAEKDNSDGNRKDIDNALAGYYSLTEQQKILFFKALCNRGILDISKKNYKSNLFNLKDRNYVNPAARDKLIDQYIEANLEDNIGLSLENDEYYRAMEALYTTQISDRVRLTKQKNINDIFSFERNLFMKRSTAIDWKLFKRALNFVNRATEELEITEGNALLYRGAGELYKNGRIKMNYGFLRRNFHRTGNEWVRLISFNGISTAKTVGISPINSTGKQLDTLCKNIKTLGSVSKAVGFADSGYIVSGVNKLGKNLNEVKHDVKTLEKSNTESYIKLQEQIDSIIFENNSVTAIVDKLESFTNEYLLLDKVFSESKPLTDKKHVNPDKKNIVEKNAKGVVLNSNKGDIRDDIKNTYDTYVSAKSTYENVKTFNDMALNKIPIKKVREFVRLMEYSVEKAAYKFANDKLFKGELDPNATDKLKAMKDAVDNYVTETFDKIAGRVGVSAKKITKYASVVDAFKKRTQLRINSAMRSVNLVKKAADDVMNIASYASNISALDQTKKQSESFKTSDKGKLENAKTNGRLDEGQLKKARNAADKNQGMADLSMNISKTMQKMGLGMTTIKVATRIISAAVDISGFTDGMISKAVNCGLAFAMFAIRIVTDKNALKEYYTQTDAGKREVEKIRNGYINAGKTKLLNKFNKETDPKTASTDLVSMISQAKGYEDTSELVANTGMSMAQSIIFSASEFNPMGQSKVMAITVMSVMGLSHLIGNTSPGAVEQLYNAFKMKR